MDNEKERRFIDVSDLDAPEGWDESDIPNFGEMIREIPYRLIREFVEAEEERLIDCFLDAIGITWDDPIIENATRDELLEDARTIRKILKKYHVNTYVPSYPKRPQSKYEKFAALILTGDMTKDEAIELAARETYDETKRGIPFDDLYKEEKDLEFDRARKGIEYTINVFWGYWRKTR